MQFGATCAFRANSAQIRLVNPDSVGIVHENESRVRRNKHEMRRIVGMTQSWSRGAIRQEVTESKPTS